LQTLALAKPGQIPVFQKNVAAVEGDVVAGQGGEAGEFFGIRCAMARKGREEDRGGDKEGDDGSAD